jgi:hypothetical protein
MYQSGSVVVESSGMRSSLIVLHLDWSTQADKFDAEGFKSRRVSSCVLLLLGTGQCDITDAVQGSLL